MKPTSIPFGKGINNKLPSHSLPTDKKGNPAGFSPSVINGDFDNEGNFKGRKNHPQLYAGDCSSYWKRYFVEGGDLKYLNADNTATTIKAGVGDGDISYTQIADGQVFFSHPGFCGAVINGIFEDWGVTRPEQQPDAIARPSGGMLGGDYQVAITWLRTGKESGTVNTIPITVSDGGGIVLDNFPAPPVDIDQVAVYVSSVNGKDLYLYGEYPANVSEVFIDKHISDIELVTLLKNKPNPATIIQEHYNRIYMAVGSIVYYSDAQDYGLFSEEDDYYWTFPSEVTLLISLPGMMYVGTRDKIYQIINIDGEGYPVRRVVKEYGAVQMLNTEYDTDNNLAYFRSTKGDCVASVEGIAEITAANVAMDEYGSVTMTLIETDGFKKLVGVSQSVVKATNLKAKV